MAGLPLWLCLLALAVTPSHQWSVMMIPNASKRMVERYTQFETSCIMTSSAEEPTPDIELYHNETLLGDRVAHGYVKSTVKVSYKLNEKIQTRNYTVDRADLRDAGAYTCKGDYVGFDITVKIFSFKEQHVPEYEVDAGEELSFSNCAFEPVSAGYQGPDKVMWMFNDAMLPAYNSKYKVLENDTLLIENIGHAEKGLYQCYLHFYYDDGQNSQTFYSRSTFVTVISEMLEIRPYASQVLGDCIIIKTDTSGSQTIFSLDKWLLSAILVLGLVF